MEIDNFVADAPAQVLEVENIGFDFERGGYEIKSGPEATSLLIDLAMKLPLALEHWPK